MFSVMGNRLELQSPEERLAGFLAKFTPEIAARADAILQVLRRRFPRAIEMVYDNYNALAIGFGPSEKSSEAIVSIAVFPRWVSLFFLQAKTIDDSTGILTGNGKVVKHLVLDDAKVLARRPVQALLKQAETRARIPMSASPGSKLIIKSVSAKQRPRRPLTTVAAQQRRKIRPPDRRSRTVRGE